MKVTKASMQNVVREKLSTNPTWAIKAMVKIYQENQTDEEQTSNTTIQYNGIGFSGTDARILSAFSKCVIDGKSLSQKQMVVIHKLMPKYAKQVIKFSNPEKLIAICQK